jgi:hypothetical protein
MSEDPTTKDTHTEPRNDSDQIRIVEPVKEQTASAEKNKHATNKSNPSTSWIISRFQSWQIRRIYQRKREWGKPTDWAIVFLTLGILLAALAQTKIFRKQWKEMVLAGKQADRAIKETNRLASAAEVANRPWMGLAEPIHLEMKGSQAFAQYKVQNFGKTPAFKVMAQLRPIFNTAKEIVFGETGRNLPGIAWEFLLPGIGLGETAGDSENIHGSRGEEGDDRQRNQGLEHHARFGPARENCCIRW